MTTDTTNKHEQDINQSLHVLKQILDLCVKQGGIYGQSEDGAAAHQAYSNIHSEIQRFRALAQEQNEGIERITDLEKMNQELRQEISEISADKILPQKISN